MIPLTDLYLSWHDSTHGHLPNTIPLPDLSLTWFQSLTSTCPDMILLTDIYLTQFHSLTSVWRDSTHWPLPDIPFTDLCLTWFHSLTSTHHDMIPLTDLSLTWFHSPTSLCLTWFHWLTSAWHDSIHWPQSDMIPSNDPSLTWFHSLTPAWHNSTQICLIPLTDLCLTWFHSLISAWHDFIHWPLPSSAVSPPPAHCLWASSPFPHTPSVIALPQRPWPWVHCGYRMYDSLLWTAFHGIWNKKERIQHYISVYKVYTAYDVEFLCTFSPQSNIFYELKVKLARGGYEILIDYTHWVNSCSYLVLNSLSDICILSRSATAMSRASRRFLPHKKQASCFNI